MTQKALHAQIVDMNKLESKAELFKKKALVPFIGSFMVLALVLTFTLVAIPPVNAQDQNVQEYLSLLQSVYLYVLQNYVDEVDPQVLYEGAMKGLFEALNDPYSVFLDEQMLNDLNDTTSGKFGGIGLYISKPLPANLPAGKKAWVEVVSPIEDTPGWKAGIQPGDYITHIDGESTEEMTMEQVLSKLRGEPNTKVTITIQRGANIRFNETITRAIIEIPTVKKAMVDKTIGYLRIIEFTPQTAQRVKEALDWLRQNGAISLILDLRNNPGGLLSSVVQVADMFIDSGVIVSTKSRNKYDNNVYKAKSSIAVSKDMPIVVLINKGSASAAEILAGALKDNKRAYLVGETTYGKGSVQQVIAPVGKTGFKLTMSRYYTPSDANIDKLGIIPDLIVKEPELTEQEEKDLTRLIEQNAFGNFAEKNPDASDKEINAFVQGLKSSGITVSERILRKMVRNELDRTKMSPVFDLEYDLQLQEALKVLKSGQYSMLVNQTLSVLELQQRSQTK